MLLKLVEAVVGYGYLLLAMRAHTGAMPVRLFVLNISPPYCDHVCSTLINSFFRYVFRLIYWRYYFNKWLSTVLCKLPSGLPPASWGS